MSEERDRRFARPPAAGRQTGPGPGPHFLMMSPRTPANAGLAARALKNFGFRSLALVALPDNGKDYFGDHARGAAWRAFDVLLDARTPATLAEAHADLATLIAVDPEPAPEIPRLTLESAAALALDDPDRSGFLFGRESSGLTRDELDWATHALVLPSSPEYPDLNVAQAVLLVAAEIDRERRRRAAGGEIVVPDPGDAASGGEIRRLAVRAQAWLLAIGFLHPSRPGLRRGRALLRMLLRCRPRRHEIALLLGVVADAAKGRSVSSRRGRAPKRSDPRT